MGLQLMFFFSLWIALFHAQHHSRKLLGLGWPRETRNKRDEIEIQDCLSLRSPPPPPTVCEHSCSRATWFWFFFRIYCFVEGKEMILRFPCSVIEFESFSGSLTSSRRDAAAISACLQRTWGLISPDHAFLYSRFFKKNRCCQYSISAFVGGLYFSEVFKERVLSEKQTWIDCFVWETNLEENRIS